MATKDNILDLLSYLDKQKIEYALLTFEKVQGGISPEAYTSLGSTDAEFAMLQCLEELQANILVKIEKENPGIFEDESPSKPKRKIIKKKKKENEDGADPLQEA